MNERGCFRLPSRMCQNWGINEFRDGARKSESLVDVEMIPPPLIGQWAFILDSHWPRQ